MEPTKPEPDPHEAILYGTNIPVLVNEKPKSWLRWVYDWITVITSVVVGFISTLAADQLAPFIGAEGALKLVMGVAITKGAIEYAKSEYAKSQRAS